MKILYISGSPRENGNTEILLNTCLSVTGGQLLKLKNYKIAPCQACWACVNAECCAIPDDMTNIITPSLLNCDGIVLGSPVFFNNVTSILKAFMDRTWCLKGKLRNKIGAAIAIGRGYGIESAITAMNSFFLKHEMVISNRGVSGIAYEKGEILHHQTSLDAAKQLGKRINEVFDFMN